jgi:Ca-activated chloride channel family protein
MRKPILLIGIFVTIAVIALVYATQFRPTTNFVPFVKTPVSHPTTNGNVEFEWKLANPYLLRQEGLADAYLDLRVTGKTLSSSERKPLNLVLVIDRSGSMGDENKLEQVKQAAAAIVNQMNAADRLALVVYNDTVQTILPSTTIESAGSIRELLYSLTPDGSTNLGGGLQQGFEEVRKNFRQDAVNRVILLSDGLANVGIIDPEQIAAVAKSIRDRSISVSTMGVGIDYNENLMANIADHSGGNYYYISRDVNMADIFRREWNLMQSVIANNAVATLELAKGVEVEDVGGFQWSVDQGKLRIQLPDIYSGETKRVLVHLRAPSSVKTLVNLGKGEFTCIDISSGKPQTIVQTFSPSIQVIEDKKVVVSNYDRDVQSKVASVEASKGMEEAYKAWEEGNQSEAQKIATDANDKLQALGYTQNKEQVQRYNNFLHVLNEPAPVAPEAKKDILKKQKAEDRQVEQSSPQ